MKEEIRNYILKELERGAHINAIRYNLLKHGHPDFVVDEAIKDVQHDRAMEEVSHGQPFSDINIAFKTIAQNLLSFLFIVFFIILMFLTSVGTHVSFITILLAFSPTIISIVVVGVAKRYLPHKELLFLWCVPLLAAALFVVAHQYALINAFAKIDLLGVGILNIILSCVYIGLSLIGRKKESVTKPLKDVLNALERSCANINMVIDVVYGLDSLVRLDDELVDKLTAITARDIMHNRDGVLIFVRMLKDALKKLEVQEQEIFGASMPGNVRRAADGSDPVLVVLQTNSDKDITKYYEDAIKACDDLTSILMKP